MSYVPVRGDVVWLSFDPQSGREQAGRRPALVLSPRAYNQRTSLAIACPITSQIKGYPFEVVLPPDSQIQGVILCDQVKSLDWRVRRADFVETVPEEVVIEAQQKLRALLGL